MNPRKKCRFGLLLWALLGAVQVHAQAPDEVSAPQPALRVSDLRVGPPLKQGYAYQVRVGLVLVNPGDAAVPGAFLTFTYVTLTGERIACVNQSFPTQATAHPGQVRVPPLEAGESRELEGQLLVPVIWYRGLGRLHVSVRACAEAPEAPGQCGEPPADLPPAEDSVELFLY